MPRLEYVLAGVKRAEAHTGASPRRRLPITLDIMQLLQRAWVGEQPHEDGTMLWAAACIGFFGFLRSGEFTVPSPATYDPEVHLNLADLAIDNPDTPTVVCISIKQSKTDPFRQGARIYLGRTEKIVCPVRAIINYIGIRPPDPGPLFVRTSGTPLTRAYLVSCLQAAIRQAGREDSAYNGHSFRSGAATTAAQNGLEDSLIQTLGRWRSDAFKLYIKIPQAQLASISRTLARTC